MALLSLVLTLLSVFTFWLVIPLFVLPPLAAYLGYRSFRARRQSHPGMGRIGKLVSMLPMLLAIVAFPLELYVFNAGYIA